MQFSERPAAAVADSAPGLEGALGRPDRVVVEVDGQPVQAGQVLRCSQAFAASLRPLGPCRVAVHTARADHILAALMASRATQCELLLVRELYPPEALFWQTCGVRAVFDENLALLHQHHSEVKPQQSAVLLTTSGTTGKPKVAAHDLARLLGRIRPDPIDGRWLLTYHPGSFAGLQVLLTALCTNSVLVAFPGVAVAELALRVSSEKITHLSATPTFFKSLLLTLRGEPQRTLRQITLGGEPVDQSLLDELHRSFPDARLIHIYASTEAGALFAVRDLRAGFPAEWLGSGIDGCSLRIRQGVLEVQSPRAMQRYVGQETESKWSEDGWLITGDLVEVAGDRVLFCGRLDNLINVGGAKVRPEEVETVLLQVPGVRDARVYGQKNPITGAMLVADVALAADLPEAEARKRITSFLSAQLEPFKVPRLYHFVGEVCTNAAGKKVRGVS